MTAVAPGGVEALRGKRSLDGEGDRHSGEGALVGSNGCKRKGNGFAKRALPGLPIPSDVVPRVSSEAGSNVLKFLKASSPLRRAPEQHFSITAPSLVTTHIRQVVTYHGGSLESARTYPE